jgi:glycosyltransferase involved in cell wall biosynthesis
MTSVDVFIPCYNYGRFLGRCVNSILSRGGAQVGVLIIDDTSTDDSLEEAGRIAAGVPRGRASAEPGAGTLQSASPLPQRAAGLIQEDAP